MMNLQAEDILYGNMPARGLVDMWPRTDLSESLEYLAVGTQLQVLIDCSQILSEHPGEQQSAAVLNKRVVNILSDECGISKTSNGVHFSCVAFAGPTALSTLKLSLEERPYRMDAIIDELNKIRGHDPSEALVDTEAMLTGESDPGAVLLISHNPGAVTTVDSDIVAKLTASYPLVVLAPRRGDQESLAVYERTWASSYPGAEVKMFNPDPGGATLEDIIAEAVCLLGLGQDRLR